MEYWLLAAGAALLVWTWLLVRNGYVTGWAKLEESRKQLEQQATELAIVAEEVLADLSERTERLRQLIAQADAVLARVPDGEPALATVAADRTPAQARTDAPVAPAAATVWPDGAAVAPPDRTVVPPARTFARPEPPAVETAGANDAESLPPALALLSALEAAAAETAGSGEARVERGRNPVPPGHQRVWDLAEQGEPVTEIARRLQKTQGEVELILGLRRLG